MREKKPQGLVLIEILITMGIFVTLLSATAQLMYLGLQSVYLPRQETKAAYLLSEYQEAARSLKSGDWDNLIPGSYYLQISASGAWQLIPSPQGEEVDGFWRQVAISPVQRDQNDNLVETGGMTDLNIKKIDISIKWQGVGIQRNLSTTTYISRLENKVWQQTLKAEFDAGEKNYVVITEDDNGEIKLAGGCEPGQLPKPNIFDESFLNGWKIPFLNWPPAKIYVNQVPSYDGPYSFRIKFSNVGDWTYLINWSDVCTRGFKKLKFYAYNSAVSAKTISMGTVFGGWSYSFSLPPQQWQEVIIPYFELNGGKWDNIWNLYFRLSSGSTGDVYFDEMELIEGSGGYFNRGELNSSVFDAGRETIFNRVFFSGLTPPQTSIGLQIATSDNADGPWEFIGPEGTTAESDLYTNSDGEGIYLGNNYGRYLKYKAVLQSFNGEQTPVVYSVGVNYVP